MWFCRCLGSPLPYEASCVLGNLYTRVRFAPVHLSYVNLILRPGQTTLEFCLPCGPQYCVGHTYAKEKKLFI